MFLEADKFSTVVKHTPLVSIDLIVRNDLGQILTGMRVNRPAQGFWFVPGGRVAKDETLANAFARLVEEELGVSLSLDQAHFLGVYEHFYKDNFSSDDFSTHYVVLGYELKLNIAIDKLPCDQHSLYRWFDEQELLNIDTVHSNTKAYFTSRQVL